MERACNTRTRLKVWDRMNREVRFVNWFPERKKQQKVDIIALDKISMTYARVMFRATQRVWSRG